MKKGLVIVTPVYNDWQSFKMLVKELLVVTSKSNFTIEAIVAVNDGSSESLNDSDINSLIPITLINLNTNMGHQRAISIGLSYVNDQFSNYDYSIVMDCDGEDRPQDIKKLIDFQVKSQIQAIVFAKRQKRKEGMVFKLFYNLYKFIFKLLTKQHIDFGNFSSIPKSLVPRVVSIPELWNHYSGGVIKSKIHYTSLGTDKGDRYHGTSKMNFQNLVLHGLSSISIYLDVISIRLLLFAFFSSTLVILGLFVIVYLTMFTSIPIPGWSSLTGFLLINILAIFILTTFLILLFQLNQKTIVKLPPKAFYKDFILSVRKLNYS